MIDLTVKTLDSQNHTFSLEDDITVRGFKEYIAESVSVPADSQRLIYCGRVLQDEKKLNEYDVSGKVIHLVQRAPPQPGQRSNSGNQNQGQRTGWSHSFRLHYRHARTQVHGNSMYLGLPMPAPNYYLSTGRLSVAKRMLDQANQVIDRLDDPNSPANPGPAASTASSLPRQEPTPQEADQEQQDNNDYGPIGGARLAQAASAAVVAAISAAGLNNVRLLRGRTEEGDEVAVLSNAFDDGIPRTQSQQQQPSQPQQQSQQQQQQEPPLQQRGAPSGAHEQINERLPPLSVPRPPQMAELLDRLLSTQERLKPYIERYRVLMHADPSLSPGAGPEGVEENQRVVDGVSKSLHNISHACHALSDIIVDMGQEPPRNLSCRPILIEHSAVLQAGIPIQVEVNQANAVPEDTNQQENRPNQRERDPQQPQSQTAFGTVFNLPNNVEVLVEVSPESTMETAPSGEQTQNNRNNNNVNAGDTDGGAFPWGTPPTMDFIRNLMQIVAGHVVQGGAATTTMSMSNATSTAAGGQTTAAMADGTSPYPGQSTQARSNMGTHPTTSTQTRSTPRPHVFHPRVHPLEVGYEIARPRLGGFDPYLRCNSHHLHRTVSAATQTTNGQQRSTVDQSTAPESGSQSQPTTTSSATNSDATSSSPNAQPFNHFAIHLHELLNETGGQPQSGASTAGTGIRHGWGSLIQILTGSGPRVGFLGDGNNQSLADVTLADLLESELFMDNDSVEGQRRRQYLFHNLTIVLMQNITLEGLLRLRLGSWEPLANLRRSVREFLQRFFASATSPMEIQEQAVERLISEFRPPLRQIFLADVESIGGTMTRVDIAATVEALLRRYIRDLLALLYDDAADDTRFGQAIVTMMSELGANLCFVLRYYFHNGQAGLEAIVMRIMIEMIERGIPGSELMVNSFVSFFRTYSSRLPQPPVSEILPLLVHHDDANAPSSTPSVPVQQSQAEPEPMETEVVEVRTTTTDEALAADDSDEDPGIFPGHEALPSDWVPIIARDGARQRRQLQMQGMTGNSVTTFSDAYLGGMPSKRRKLIEQQKPCLLASPTPNHSSISMSVERLIREGVGRAGVEEIEGAAATVATDAGVRHAFGQAIRDCLHPQRYGTPDFPDPLRFPNATKFFANHERNSE